MNTVDLEKATRCFPTPRIRDISRGEEALDSFEEDDLRLLIFACGRHYGARDETLYGSVIRWCLLSTTLAVQELERRIKGRSAPADCGIPPPSESVVAEAADPASRPTLFNITTQIQHELSKLIDRHGPITDDPVVLKVINLVGGL